MKGNHKGNSGNGDHRSPDNIHSKHNMDEAVQHPSGDDNGTTAQFKSGERHKVTDSGDNKLGRQGGGPGEHQSKAGEQGYKSENNFNTNKEGSATKSGEVRGAGTLKDGSSSDQDWKYGYNNSDYSDDIKQTRWNRQDSGPGAVTGSANRKGGDADGRGGGKSSGHEGMNNPDNPVKVNKRND
ncbi:hypothetical protein [Adhaeribacter aquaticus]|uniref:hypothetical protein n=1 Tax=Adhaeribacter aquaticus TaxID=299567 RepID=UPI00047A8746|nr:hypothetical protein [Adhaeribacter aquaticus]